MFSPDGTLISASAAPHCGSLGYKGKRNKHRHPIMAPGHYTSDWIVCEPVKHVRWEVPDQKGITRKAPCRAWWKRLPCANTKTHADDKGGQTIAMWRNEALQRLFANGANPEKALTTRREKIECLCLCASTRDRWNLTTVPKGLVCDGWRRRDTTKSKH